MATHVPPSPARVHAAVVPGVLQANAACPASSLPNCPASACPRLCGSLDLCPPVIFAVLTSSGSAASGLLSACPFAFLGACYADSRLPISLSACLLACLRACLPAFGPNDRPPVRSPARPPAHTPARPPIVCLLVCLCFCFPGCLLFCLSVPLSVRLRLSVCLSACCLWLCRCVSVTTWLCVGAPVRLPG